MFGKCFFDERFYVDLDVMSSLVDVDTVVHVEVPLSFNRNRYSSSIRSISMSEVVASGDDIAKSSTCLMKSTRW